MKEKLCKWLPIFFGCHQKPDRSFFYHGKQFPICARCTGELLGMIIGLVGGFIFKIPWYFLILGACPMIMDGFCQQLTKYESNNTKRLLTGILFGFVLGYLVGFSTKKVFFIGFYKMRFFKG